MLPKAVPSSPAYRTSTEIKNVSRQDIVVTDVPTRAQSVTTPLVYHALTFFQGQHADLQDFLKYGSPFPVRTVTNFLDGRQTQLRYTHSTTASFHLHSLLPTMSLSPSTVLATPMSTPPSGWSKRVFYGLDWGKIAERVHALLTSPTLQGMSTSSGPLRELRNSIRFFRTCISSWMGRCLSRLDLLLPHGHGHTRSPEALFEITADTVSRLWSLSGLLFSTAPSKSATTMGGNSRAVSSRRCPRSADPLIEDFCVLTRFERHDR